MQYDFRGIRDEIYHRRVMRETGGRFFDSHYTQTIVSGTNCIWWWKPGADIAKVRADCEDLGREFAKISKNIEFLQVDRITPGRLIRLFIKHVLKPKFDKQTLRYGDKYYYLAHQREIEINAESDRIYNIDADLLQDNSHWHYLYLADKPTGFGIELDLKSAYITSLLKQRTLFLCDEGNGRKAYHVGDGGAMQRLREISDALPKWFRLQLLGILGSHAAQFATWDRQNNTLVHDFKRVDIKYGMAFNAVHQAIYNLYILMSSTAREFESDLIRCHTDSFTFRASMITEDENSFLEKIDKAGFKLSCKGFGWANFWNIDCGILGTGKPKGKVSQLKELVRRDNISLPNTPVETIKRWQHWLPGLPDDFDENYQFIHSSTTNPNEPNRLKGYWKKSGD